MKEPQRETALTDGLLDEAVTVATSLQALNETLEQQRRSIALLCEQLSRATIDLATYAQAVQAGDKKPISALFGSDGGVGDFGSDGGVGDFGSDGGVADLMRQKVDAATQAATRAEGDVPAVTGAADVPPGPEARAALVKAYENTLSAQVQLNTIAEAALTQGISILYAEVGTALGRGTAEAPQEKSGGVSGKATR